MRRAKSFWAISGTVLVLLLTILFHADSGSIFVNRKPNSDPFKPEDKKIVSQFSVTAGRHQIDATIYGLGRGSRDQELLVFRLAADKRILKSMKANGFKQPVLFRYDRKNFLYVSTEAEGSGAFVTETIFWIAPDGSLNEIDCEHAAASYEDKANPQETVLSGGPSVVFSGGELRFEFYIANNGDPHCCPSAGKVTGNYRIIGEAKFDPATNRYVSTLQMVVDQYLRVPLSSEEMAAAGWE